MPQRQEEPKLHKEKHKPLSPEEESIGKEIVNATYFDHKALGPGLFEKVYKVRLCHIRTKDSFFVKRQLDIPIVFENNIFEEGLGQCANNKRWN